MSHPIHVNLFLKSEMRSAAPVRFRVMAPVAAFVLAAIVLVLALVLRSSIGEVQSDLSRVQLEIKQLEPRHQDFKALTASWRTANAGLEQLRFFKSARLEWGAVLQALPQHVPASVQFLEFQHSYPPLPQPAPGAQLLASTNRLETGRVVVSGRTTSSDSVALLLAACREPPLNALLEQAKVPPGAFRQEPRRTLPDAEVLLFDLESECPPRRFE